VQPRTADGDVDLARRLAVARLQVLAVELEQAEKVHEVRFHEAQAAQIGELVVAKAQRAKIRELRLHLLQVRLQVHARRAALEFVLDLRPRKVMQHHLHHGELVEIRVEQRLDEHGRAL
jgi:hypothetical protein